MSPPATPENLGEIALSLDRTAPGAAVGTVKGSIDAALRAIMDVWPRLPADVRHGILELAGPYLDRVAPGAGMSEGDE